MGVWTELVGVRKDLRLRAKWWHHVAVGMAVFSALIVYLVVAGGVMKRRPKLTTANTFSESMLRAVAARQPATTTLFDLEQMGSVGSAAANGEFVPLPRPAGADIRCEVQAKFKAGESVKVGETSYRAMPDRPDQPEREGRHCVATAAYAGLTAASISVFRPDETGVRKRTVQAFLVGVSACAVWLVVYWNIYYRGFMAIYAKRRQIRKRRHFERQGVR